MHETEDRLQQEILADAQRKAARTIERAERDAGKSTRTVQRRHDRVRTARLNVVQHQADERRLAITASIEHETRRRWLLARERELDEFFDRTLEGLEHGIGVDTHESLRQLTEEALSAIGAGDLVLRVRPDDVGVFTEQLLSDLARQVGLETQDGVRVRVEPDASMRPGVVLTTADGRKTFDNTYAIRLRRLKPRLRGAVIAGQERDDEGTQHA